MPGCRAMTDIRCGVLTIIRRSRTFMRRTTGFGRWCVRAIIFEWGRKAGWLALIWGFRNMFPINPGGDVSALDENVISLWFKLAGLQRTYPDAINFEGVHGLEEMKWAKPGTDQVFMTWWCLSSVCCRDDGLESARRFSEFVLCRKWRMPCGNLLGRPECWPCG